jgi:hypothetical protein
MFYVSFLGIFWVSAFTDLQYKEYFWLASMACFAALIFFTYRYYQQWELPKT